MQSVSNTEDQPADYVRELSTTIIATSAILLALIWGLVNVGESRADIEFTTIKVGTVGFLIAIVFALATLQYIVTLSMGTSKQPNSSLASDLRILIPFTISWVAFLAGCIGVGLSIFLSDFDLT